MGFSKKNPGVGLHALFQGIFPTWGSDVSIIRQILHPWATWEAQKGMLGDKTELLSAFSPVNHACPTHQLHTLPPEESSRNTRHTV